MYSTCIFCHANLATNESIEHFPIGRRLAFDAARGRLWVVCRKCERWNLTPLEERWEAIEECERLFGATKLRVSTDHIGLARLKEGLELIRIGQPQRSELAAWRYGDQFGRRRRRYLAYTSLGAAAMLALMAAGPATGIFLGGVTSVNAFSIARNLYKGRRVRVRLSVAGRNEPALLRFWDLQGAWIEPDGAGWALNFSQRVDYSAPIPGQRPSLLWAKKFETVRITGDAAIHAMAKVLPAINEAGARRSQVQSAIQIVEDAGDRDALLRRWVEPRVERGPVTHKDPSPALRFSAFPREALLAFEMATHEESERRALDGELSILEEMWREAEEIAAIADDLFVPDEPRRRVASLKSSAPDA